MSPLGRNTISLKIINTIKLKCKHEIIILLKYSKAKQDTWILNVLTNAITQGPSLNIGRHSHGCERLNDESILVAGGYDFGVLASTEILKVGEHEWINGPNLKEGVWANELVKSNSKEYVAYNLGGNLNDILYHPSPKIYGLNRDMNEWQLIEMMNEPHFTLYGSALNVPINKIAWCK